MACRGCYIAPDNASTIENVVAAISRQPQGGELLMTGEFNADLAKPKGNVHTEKIAKALTDSGLEDMITYFPPR